MTNTSALPRLSTTDVERLHEASLQILADKGIAVYDEELRGHLVNAGAVPSSDQLLKLPRSLVEESLSNAPRDIRLYDMLGESIKLEAGSRLLTTPGDSLHFYDASNDTVRDPVLDDVGPYVRLADALPEIAITRGQPMALREPEGFLGILLVTEQLLLNTTKHHFISPIGVDMVDVWVDVASIVRSGEPIGERPFFSAMICPISPLRIGIEGEQKLVALAKHKIPIAATCAPIMGATAPYTQAGTLALMNAENLAILISAQVVQPGTPVFFAPAPSMMDMATAAICMATPEFFQMHLGAMSLAEFYGLPNYHQLAHTDSPSLDYQAGLERGLSMLAWWLAGPALMGSAGQFHKATIASPEQLLMDAEWYRHVRTLCGSFAVNDEELAFDEIADTEPGGNFLIGRRTLEHLRDGSRFSSQVFNRDSLQGSPRPALERAQELVAEIVSNHSPEVPTDIADEIRTYVGERRLSAEKGGESGPHRLEELKYQLDQMQVYHWSEVEAFSRVFYLPRFQQREKDHARLEAALQPARDRFTELNDEDQTEFRDRLQAFVNLYVFLSQIIPYGDSEQERLSSFGRALLPHLRPERDGDAINLGDDVELAYYRLQRVSSGAISLGEGDGGFVVSPTEVGTGDPEEDTAPLSEIIKRLNERFGTEFTDEDRLFFEQVKERAVRNEHVRQTALANSLDKFSLGIRDEIGKLMTERMGENDALVTRYLSDKDFQNIAFEVLAREIFEEVETKAAPTRRAHA